jgi:hypothetical protein
MPLDRDLDIGCCVSGSVYPFLGLKEGDCVLCCAVLCCALLRCAVLCCGFSVSSIFTIDYITFLIVIQPWAFVQVLLEGDRYRVLIEAIKDACLPAYKN